MKLLVRVIDVVLVLGLLLTACGAPQTPEPTKSAIEIPAATPTPDENVLYLNLMWHQHQPLYYKDADGVYTRPWVRVHATKDYYDMAALVGKYPAVHVTFNLTPVLIRQLDDFVNNGTKDLYWVMAEKPASALTEDDKRFLLQRFFDANWTNVIGRFPRYRALLDKRGGTTEAQIDAALQSFTEQDFRDLQVWFNLAWFDPDFLAQEPLKSLIEKGEGFSEADKAVIFTEVRKIMAEVIPIHRQLQDAGQIEVTTSPLAHAILPLLYDTKLELVGNPEAKLPPRFSYPNDAIAQLNEGAQVYEDHFGEAPRGLWPSEGAVAQEVVPLVAKAGYKWMASGEQVLAESLGIGSFTRDSQDTVKEADALYRPYWVQGPQGNPVLIVFRDLRLSDLIGFEYSQTPGQEAAADLLRRLENIRQALKTQGVAGPHLVSIVLDGENAWENYPNDGKAFLNVLYQGLSDSKTIKTVTPSEYAALFPDQKKLDHLFAGAWFSTNYDTWIGEPEENTAWDYLRRVREDLARYDLYGKKTAPSPEALRNALEYMYFAEGSDWFWWYGSDQDSGNDWYFDQGFRALLAGVYTSLGEQVPAFVNVPIIPQRPVDPTQGLQGAFTPRIDGAVNPSDEWAKAATYPMVGGAQARAEDLGTGLFFGLDKDKFYLRLDLKSDWSSVRGARVSFYLGSPRLSSVQAFRRSGKPGGGQALIGFNGTNLIEVSVSGGTANIATYLATKDEWVSTDLPAGANAAISGKVLELAVPLQILGDLEPGDDLRLVAVLAQGERDLQAIPSSGPARVIVPDLGLTTVILQVSDPAGDDHGPGSYTCATDGVFEPQVFDLKTFTVGYDPKNLIFAFEFYGPIPNPWGSPNNLALQTLDVYVDKDPGAGTGARMLLPGRNAALAKGYGWEYAVWAEGWTPEFVAPDASGAPKQVGGVDFKIIVDPAAKRVTLRVPRDAFGDGDPTKWAYAAAVLSQDGFPSAGIWRVRDVLAQAQQWRMGGGPEDTNHTRILDLAWPEGQTPTQEEILSKYPASKDPIDSLAPEDFAQIPMLTGK